MAARKKNLGKTKADASVSVQRVLRSLASVYNPIRNLTPQLLASQIDSFEAGYLRSLAMTMEKIEDRDDTLKSVAPKRKKSVSRHGYEILTTEDSPKAEGHKEELEFFYNNLTSTSAVDRNVRGGFRLLVKQMMDAIGKRYAAHEIVWRPETGGLTADFFFVPLWFFENKTGALRYLESDGATNGVDLAPGEWMVTAGDGLMIACSICYMFKHIPLKDWLIYCERHGMPGLHGKTDATEGSSEWDTLVSALQNFGVDWSVVTSKGVDVDPVDMTAKGELPYPKLIERMDRALASLWRGADLSTMSASQGEGTGASLQGEESDILEEDDVELISETLNEQVDRYVIYYQLGDTEPLAYIKVNKGNRQDVKQDIEVDKFLHEAGVPLALTDLYERYGRSRPDKKEDLVAPHTGGPTPPPAPDVDLPNARQTSVAALSEAVNEELRAAARSELAQAQAADLEAVVDRLTQIAEGDDAEFRDNALRNLQRELPKILIKMNEAPAAAEVIEQALAAALINGYAEAATEHQEVKAA